MADGTILESLLALDGVVLPRGGGANKMVECFSPSHDDRNASMSVNVSKGVYNCHGCGIKGNAYASQTCLLYTSPSPRDS